MRKNAKLKTSFHTQTHKMFSKSSKRAFKVGVILLSLFLLPIHTVKAEEIGISQTNTSQAYLAVNFCQELDVNDLDNITNVEISYTSIGIGTTTVTLQETRGWGDTTLDSVNLINPPSGWATTSLSVETLTASTIYLCNRDLGFTGPGTAKKFLKGDNTNPYTDGTWYGYDENWLNENNNNLYDVAFKIWTEPEEPEPIEFELCELPENTLIQRISGCMNVYTDSTSTPSEIREWQVDIPMILFIFIYLLGAISIGVIYIYILMKKRK